MLARRSETSATERSLGRRGDLVDDTREEQCDFDDECASD